MIDTIKANAKTHDQFVHFSTEYARLHSDSIFSSQIFTLLELGDTPFHPLHKMILCEIGKLSFKLYEFTLMFDGNISVQKIQFPNNMKNQLIEKLGEERQ